MTLVISEDGAVFTNEADLSGSPAVRITGDAVNFANSGTGSIVSTSDDVAAIVIAGAGVVITNEGGGQIAATDALNLAILGSAGNDTVVDAGTMTGFVRLGGGSDSFTAYTNLWGGGRIDLGAGNDVYRHSVANAPLRFMTGGTGYDRLVLGSYSSVIEGTNATGFERLEIARGGNVWNLFDFSDYLKVILTAGGSFNFANSDNPGADISFTGSGDFTNVAVGPGSAFRNVTGTSGEDLVEVAGAVSGDILLGAGDDGFWYKHELGDPAPVVGGTIDGGQGTDRIGIIVEGGRTVDLAPMIGFETVDTGTFTSQTSNVRLINVNGYERIDGDNSGGKLVLAQSHSPNAAAVPGMAKGTLILEATATVGQIGLFFDYIAQKQTASPVHSTSVINGGEVLGSVYFDAGHDYYDGRLGSAGGGIYGFAGNDVLIGGVGGDEIYGGWGNDRLDGGAGADAIDGGPGDDRLTGGTGGDALTGGTGSDIYFLDHAGDRVIEGGSGVDIVNSAVSFSLPTHVEKLVLTGGAGISGAGNSGNNTITGNAAGNLLSGGRGNDFLDGGAGHDSLYGSAGNDSLKGGTGLDRFLFTAAPGAGNVDKILDFSVADDSIWLARYAFAALGPRGTLAADAFHQGSAAADAGDRILYDQGNGRIYYDSDGSGSAAALLFAIVSPGTPLTNADFIIYG